MADAEHITKTDNETIPELNDDLFNEPSIEPAENELSDVDSDTNRPMKVVPNFSILFITIIIRSNMRNVSPIHFFDSNPMQ